MKVNEWTWKSRDGLTMHARTWQPERDAKGVVCLLHGLGEHSGRYAYVGRAFSDDGFVLAGFDLRGHGKSEGKPGHIPTFAAYMDDIEDFKNQVEERFSGLPRVLYGHSLGGVLVLDYTLQRESDFLGVVSTGPTLRTAVEEQKGKVFMSKVFGALLPGFTITSGLDPATLSRDPQVIREYMEDPMVHDKMTLGFGKIMLSILPWTFEHAHEFSLPLLIMHGSDDKLCYPSGSKDFAGKVPRNCTHKVWDGMYHELHNEPGKEEVFAFIIGWINGLL